MSDDKNERGGCLCGAPYRSRHLIASGHTIQEPVSRPARSACRVSPMWARVGPGTRYTPESHGSAVRILIGCALPKIEVEPLMSPPSLMLVTCPVCLRLHEPKNPVLTNPVCSTCTKAKSRRSVRPQ